MDMHPEQLTVGVDTVRALVDRQFPAWRDLPIREVRSHGTVNALFRVGDTLVARFPLVPGEVGATRHWLETEARVSLGPGQARGIDEMLATLERERNRMSDRIRCLTRNRDAIAEYLEAVRTDERAAPWSANVSSG